MDPITIAATAGLVANLTGAFMQHEAEVDAALEQGRITEQQAQQIKAAFEKAKAATELPPGQAPVLSPVELTMIGKYAPDVAKHVQENRPDIVNDSNQGRQAQMNALDQMRGMSLQGGDAISQAATENAKFQADSANKQRQNQILQGYANRGLLTGNTAMGAELMGAQDSAVAERQAAMQAAADAQGRRANALNNYGSLAGQIRTGDVDVSKSNASIMNAYNDRMANSLNDYNKYVSNTKNAAQEYNLKVQQDVANQNATSRVNTTNTNKFNQFNQEQAVRDARNDMTNQELTNAKDIIKIRSGGASNLNTDMAKADTKQRAGVFGSLNEAGSAISSAYNKPKEKETTPQQASQQQVKPKL